MGDQVLAHSTVTGDDGDEALGHACLLEQRTQCETRKWRGVRRLAHDGVARRQRRAEEFAHDHEREVPRRDRCPDADGRAVGEHSLVARRTRDRFAVEPLGILGGDGEERCCVLDVRQRLSLVGLSLLDRRETRELLVMLLNEGSDAMTEVGTLVGRPVAIVVPGTLRSSDRGIELLRARARQVGELLAGDG
jgi:hypothetical protein